MISSGVVRSLCLYPPSFAAPPRCQELWWKRSLYVVQRLVPMVPPVRRMRKSFRSLALNCFKPRSKIYKVYHHQCAPQFNPRKISLFLLRSENVIFDKSVYSCTCICRCSRYRFPRYVIHPPVLQSMLLYICYYSSVKPYGKLNFSNTCSN